MLQNHEKRLDNHESRIGALEVNQAVLTTKVTQIAKWAGWGVAILGGSFLLQLMNIIVKGWVAS